MAQTDKTERIVVTAALPYANGDIHIGHLLEYIQADVYVRFLKLLGKDALYICASDMHGTPIEIKAKEAGIRPQQFALGFWRRHQQDFAAFQIRFDNYYKTHSWENRELSEFFYHQLKEKGYIVKRKIEVIYCSQCERNLPDRYVKGTCPNCGAYEQYGDVCESCNLTLKGTDLINPKCSICRSSPVKKEAEHYFFQISQLQEALQTWLDNTDFQPEMKNSVREWLNKGLEDWCISRDAPYFGFKIPGEKKKYFYVWLDAPLGYISSTKNYCDKHQSNWEDYWKTGQVIHIIGKDIIYFHFLFWPAMLIAADFPPPTNLHVHGFVTVNGQKMSKSRGTFFTARDFLKLYSPAYLRFYYAQHLSRKLSDIDLDFEDFQDAVNNRLIANLGNFTYRTLSFLDKNYQGKILRPKPEPKLEKQIQDLIKKIEQNYHQLNFKQALAQILKISDLGNVYFQQVEPWKNPDKAHPQVSFSANLVRNLAILIKPVLPQFAEELEKQLNQKNLQWKDLRFDFTGKINRPKILLSKIEKTPRAAVFPLDLQVGEIIGVKDHPQADSLYLLKVNFGQEVKQAVAGLRKYFKKDTLKNKKAVFCRNIRPAKLRGELSECMILVANDGRNVSLLYAEDSLPGEDATFEGYTNSKAPITFEDFKKLRMEVRNRQVLYQTRHLKTEKEGIRVRGVKDGAVIE